MLAREVVETGSVEDNLAREDAELSLVPLRRVSPAWVANDTDDVAPTEVVVLALERGRVDGVV